MFAISWNRRRGLEDAPYDAGVRRPSNMEAELARRLCPPESVLDHITDGTDVVVAVAHGAPVRLIAVAHPAFREELTREAHRMGFL